MIPLWGSMLGGAAPTLSLDFTSGALSPLINFSRASNATVTNSAGLITYAPMNLLTYSEQFDNSGWVKSNVTVTANTITAPNGTTTADKMVETTAASASHYITNGTAVVGTPMTSSIYAKAGERKYLSYAGGGFGAQGFTVLFNLQTGTLDQNTGNKGSIVSVGNGWYRCSVSFTPSTTGGPQFLMYDNAGNGTYTGDGTSGLYLWGAQLEIGSTATTYNSTTVKNLLGYSELFDNAAWTKQNSFVQTNLLTYSEAFDNAAWVAKTNITISADNTIAPNGYQTADLIVPTTTSGLHRFRGDTSITSGTTYTVSIYAKAAGYNFLYVNGLGTAAQVCFNVSNGTVAATANGTGSITPVGNGWYRCSVTAVCNSTTTFAMLFQINNSGVATDTTFAGDGTSGIYLWGAQLVQGSVAGDYRRTDAAALPVYYNGPFGYTGAEKIVETTAASSQHRAYNYPITAVNGTSYTVSVYAKAGERNWLLFNIPGISNASAWFNLTTGTIGTTQSGVINPSITAIGNGWYRCSITAISTGQAGCDVGTTTGDGVITYTGDGTSGIYVWGAQVSDSASLDPYVCNAAAAPSAAAYYGPRFDYDPVTKQPKGLLIEEQRTNLATYSEDFSQWLLTSSATRASGFLAPDGNNTAWKITRGTGTSGIYRQNVTVNATQYTASVWLKGDTAGTVLIVNANGGATPQTFNVTTSWQRFTYTFNANGANDGLYVYTTGGAGQLSSWQMWGAQMEAGSFATSYIPTAASSVTRSADIVRIQGSNFWSFWNQNAGSFYTWFDAMGLSPNILSDQTTSTAFIYSSTSLDIKSFNGTSGLQTTNSFTLNTFAKAGMNYDSTGRSVVLNNGTVVSASGAITLATQLSIGTAFAGYINGHVKVVNYYNQRLDNAKFKGLTA